MPRPFALTGLTVFFVLAVLNNAGRSAAAVCAVLFAVAFFMTALFKKLRPYRVFSVVFASAAAACLLLTCVNEFYYYPLLSMSDKEYDAQILITSEPELKYGNWYSEAKVQTAGGRKASINIRLMSATSPSWEAYDTVSGKFRFYSLGQASDDLLASYKADDRFLGAYPVNNPVVNEGAGQNHPGFLLLKFRNSIRRSVMKMLPNDLGALVLALVIGDRSRMSFTLSENLRASGVTHLVCVSGFHLALWASLFLFIFRKLKVPIKAANLITCFPVILFMGIAGMGYSVIRSGIMMLLYLVSGVVFRKTDSLNSLGIAITLIACLNPYSMGAVGLQLSVLSTLGIIVYSEKVSEKMKRFFEEKHITGRLRKPIDAVIITCVAVLFVMPVTISVYRSFSVAVFPANLLIIWAAQACMILALPGVLISYFFPAVFNLPGLLCGLLAKYILKVTELFSKGSFSVLHVSEKESYMILIGVFMICALTAFMTLTGKKVILPAVAVVSAFFVSSAVFYSVADKRQTALRIFDTGNGCSVLVSYKGKNIMVGCGGDSFSGAYEIRESIDYTGGKPDAVIIYGTDERYSAYEYDIFSRYSAGKIYCSADDLFTRTLFSHCEFHTLTEEISEGEIKIENYTDEDGNICSAVETPDIYALIYADPGFDFSLLPGRAREADLVVSAGGYPASFAFDNIKLMVIQAGGRAGYDIQQSLVSAGIPAVATADSGNILVRADDGRITAERY